MTESESVENNTSDENDHGQSVSVETSGDDHNESAENHDNSGQNLSETEQLRQQLETVKSERDELEEKYLRKVADMDNLRKRAEEEKDKLRKYAHKDVLEDLLEVIDNFNRALDSMEFESEDVADGIQMIRRQLMELLEKHHAKPMEAEGDTFDPNYHEAMMQEERSDLNEQTVLEVFKQGYSLHDRVLRPAQVKVGVPSESSDSSEKSN